MSPQNLEMKQLLLSSVSGFVQNNGATVTFSSHKDKNGTKPHTFPVAMQARK